MTPLSNDAIRRLRGAVEVPDLSGTRYDLVEPIARGGMGVVFRAHDRDLDRDVALKVLSAREVSEEARARMLTEAHVLARLEHPGIVPVHDVGTLPDGRVYYTMKLVRGSRLDEYAQAHRDVNDLLRVFARVCEAVAFAHSHGIVHRDLKPENVMVGAFGEVLVMDWGVAKLLGSAIEPTRMLVADSPPAAVRGTTVTGSVMGTPGYMAPEQARGDSARVDERTDVYALGAMLRTLVETASPAGVPRRLAAIHEKARADDPAARYATVGALTDDLSRFATGRAVSAYREPWYGDVWRVMTRHRVAIGLVSAYLVMRVLIYLVNRF